MNGRTGNIFALEFKHSSFRFSAIPLVLLGILVAVSNAYPSIASWNDTALGLGMASAFLGPFWAGLGAWESLRSQRRGLTSSEGTAARPFVSVRQPQYATAVLWMLLSTLVIYAIVIARAELIGLYDQPSIIALTLPLVTSFFSLSLGFALGQLVTHWWAIVAAVVTSTAIYSVNMFPIDPYWVQAISPYYNGGFGDGYAFNTQTAVGRICFALGLVGVLLVIVLLSRRGHGRVVPLITTLTVLSGVLILAGCSIVIGQRGLTFEDRPRDEMITLTSSSPPLRLTVHRNYAPVANDLLDAWSRVAELFERSDLRFTSLTQEFNPVYEERPPGPPFRLDLNPNSGDIAGDSIDSAMMDVSSCATGTEAPAGSWPTGPLIFHSWVRGEQMARGLQLAPEDAAMVERLRELRVVEAQEWVADHVRQIVTCDWRRSDFP